MQVTIKMEPSYQKDLAARFFPGCPLLNRTGVNMKLYFSNPHKIHPESITRVQEQHSWRKYVKWQD